MKKILCLLSAALIMSFSFAGCGNGNNNGNGGSGSASSNNGSSSGMEGAVSDAISQAETMASEMADNGTVKDGDGVIGNEGSETKGSDNNADSKISADAQSSQNSANQQINTPESETML